jgi:hypothetical protein
MTLTDLDGEIEWELADSLYNRRIIDRLTHDAGITPLELYRLAGIEIGEVVTVTAIERARRQLREPEKRSTAAPVRRAR